MKSDQLKGHLAMLGCNAMWGLMAPMCKFALHTGEISSLSLAAFRMLGATSLFWLASLFAKKEKVSPQDMLMLFFAALFGIVLNQGAFTLGVGLTSPADASIITTTTPIIAMILAAFYLKEPITGKKVSGVFVSAVGALLLIIGSQQVHGQSSAGNVWGDLLVLFAQVSVASYFVFFKGLISRYSSVTLMKWMFMYASICWIPFSYREVAAIRFGDVSPAIYGSAAYVIVFGTFMTYMLLPVGQKRLRPTVVSMYNYIQPIIGSIVAVWWGMDTFGALKFIAVACVFGGVYLVTQSKSREQMEQEKRKRLRRRYAMTRLNRIRKSRQEK